MFKVVLKSHFFVTKLVPKATYLAQPHPHPLFYVNPKMPKQYFCPQTPKTFKSTIDKQEIISLSLTDLFIFFPSSDGQLSPVEVSVSSDIPIGAGLGSSAAFSVSTVSFSIFSDSDRNQLLPRTVILMGEFVLLLHRELVAWSFAKKFK